MKKFLRLLIAGLLVFGLRVAFSEPVEVALTIDDLPAHNDIPDHISRADLTKEVLAALKKHHLTEIYGFSNGYDPMEEKELENVFSLWIEDGQLLGNHTFSHLNAAKVTVQEFTANIEKEEPILSRFMGSKNYRIFRYPYLDQGDTKEKRDEIHAYLSSHHYQIAPVTIDFSDYAWNNPYVRCLKQKNYSAIQWLKKTYIEHAINELELTHAISIQHLHHDIKNILLIHIGVLDATMLDDLLTAYEQHGVKFIPLTEALLDHEGQNEVDIARIRAEIFLAKRKFSENLMTREIVQKLLHKSPIHELDQVCR